MFRVQFTLFFVVFRFGSGRFFGVGPHLVKIDSAVDENIIPAQYLFYVRSVYFFGIVVGQHLSKIAYFIVESHLLYHHAIYGREGKPMRVFHGSISYLTVLSLAIAIDPLLPF